MSHAAPTLLGRLQSVESSKLFRATVISSILLSALTIGARAYELPPTMDQWLGYLDAAMTVYFLAEILLRLAAHPNKSRCFFDGWRRRWIKPISSANRWPPRSRPSTSNWVRCMSCCDRRPHLRLLRQIDPSVEP